MNNAQHSRIDKCIKPWIKFLKDIGYNPIASCCGHNKYQMTVIVKQPNYPYPYELFTEIDVPRKRRFYLKDKQGYYYIPEVSNKR